MAINLNHSIPAQIFSRSFTTYTLCCTLGPNAACCGRLLRHAHATAPGTRSDRACKLVSIMAQCIDILLLMAVEIWVAIIKRSAIMASWYQEVKGSAAGLSAVSC